MTDLKQLVDESLNEVTAEDWEGAVRHAEQVQDNDARSDIAIEHFVESFIINLEDASDDEEI